MVLRLKTRESRSLPGLPKGEDASRSLLHILLRQGPRPSRGPFAFGALSLLAWWYHHRIASFAPGNRHVRASVLFLLAACRCPAFLLSLGSVPAAAAEDYPCSNLLPGPARTVV